MPTSENNKLKNIVRNRDKTIYELQEKVRKLDDTEVNKLNEKIIQLEKQNDEHVKNNNDLNNECRFLNSTMDVVSRQLTLRRVMAAESMRRLLVTQEVLVNLMDNKLVLLRNNSLSDLEQVTIDDLKNQILSKHHEEISRESMNILKYMKNPDFKSGVVPPEDGGFATSYIMSGVE